MSSNISESAYALQRMLEGIIDAPGISCITRGLALTMIDEVEEKINSGNAGDRDPIMNIAEMVACGGGDLLFAPSNHSIEVTPEELLEDTSSVLPLGICTKGYDTSEILASAYSLYIKLSMMFRIPIHKDYNPMWLANTRQMVKTIMGDTGDLNEVTKPALKELIIVLKNMTNEAGEQVLNTPVDRLDVGAANTVATMMKKLGSFISVSWDPEMSRYYQTAMHGYLEDTDTVIWHYDMPSSTIELFEFTVDMICATYYVTDLGDDVNIKIAAFLKVVHSGVLTSLYPHRIINLIILAYLSVNKGMAAKAASVYQEVPEIRNNTEHKLKTTLHMREKYPASLIGIVDHHNESLVPAEDKTQEPEAAAAQQSSPVNNTGGINSLLNKQAMDPNNQPSGMWPPPPPPQQQWGQQPVQQQWPPQQAPQQQWGQQPVQQQWPPQQAPQQQWGQQPVQQQWPHGGIPK